MLLETLGVPFTAPAVTLFLLAIVAPVGAIDILYFHIYRFRLYDQPAARTEVATHILRAAVIGTAALLLVATPFTPFVAATLGILLALDFLNNVVDVWLEPEARRSLGGLPPLESAIHIFGATAAGAITATYLLLWALGESPAAAPLPSWLSLQGYMLGIGSFMLATVKIGLLVRSMQRQRAAHV